MAIARPLLSHIGHRQSISRTEWGILGRLGERFTEIAVTIAIAAATADEIAVAVTTATDTAVCITTVYSQ